jgi:hypothetical protein
MRRGLIRCGVALLLAQLAACSEFTAVDDCCGIVAGSGRLAVATRPMADIEAVSIGGQGRLVIERGRQASLSITAEDNILPLLVAEVSGKRLTIRPAAGVELRPRREIVYRLRVREQVVDIDASGAVQVEHRAIDTEFLAVHLSGATGMYAAGTVAVQHVTISGAASYRAQDLFSGSAVLTVSGAAYAIINVRELLDAVVSGSALLEYLGRPRLRLRVSGSGRVAWIR